MTSDLRNCGTKDLISELPSSIIEKIFELMPIQDAARTSILSSNWRYKWTSLPHLRFDKEFIKHTNRKKINVVVNIINEILLVHDGPIRNFSICKRLFFDEYTHDLSRWLRFLSKNGIREITLYSRIPFSKNPTMLPSCFVSCQDLTYLELWNFVFEPPRVFKGFKHLTSLILLSVVISSDTFEMLVSSALDLERLTCINCPGLDTISFQAPNLKCILLSGEFKSISFGQSPFLSDASIELSKPVNDYIHDRSVSLVNMTDHWPRLKKLVIGDYALKIFAAVVIPESFSTRLGYLEHLHFDNTYFQDVDQFASAFCLITSSPNLQKLEFLNPSFDSDAIQPVGNFIKEKDFTECTLGRLRIVRMEDISGNSCELELLKYLLSSTPVLETMIVKISNTIKPQAEANFTRKLMQFRRVSPKAEVFPGKRSDWRKAQRKENDHPCPLCIISLDEEQC